MNKKLQLVSKSKRSTIKDSDSIQDDELFELLISKKHDSDPPEPFNQNTFTFMSNQNNLLDVLKLRSDGMFEYFFSEELDLNAYFGWYSIIDEKEIILKSAACQDENFDFGPSMQSFRIEVDNIHDFSNVTVEQL